MYIQLNSKIDEYGNLMLNLPREWAEKEVSIIVKIPGDTGYENNLSAAFDILASMPDDFMQEGRPDDLPQNREGWQ